MLDDEDEEDDDAELAVVAGVVAVAIQPRC